MSITIHHPTNLPNFSILNFPQGLRIGFSYETPVAFSTRHSGWVVRQNDWGATTGRHLNWFNVPKGDRIPSREWLIALAEAINDARLDERIGL